MKRDRGHSWNDQMSIEHRDLAAQANSAWDEWFETSGKHFEASIRSIRHPDDTQLAAEVAALEKASRDLEVRRDDTRAKRDAHMDKWTAGDRLYRRPTGPWARFLNHWLGPLPPQFEKVEYDRTEFDKVPSRWPLAIITSLLVVASVITLVNLLPLSSTSPANIVLGPELTTNIFVGALTGVLLVAGYRRLRGQFSFRDFFRVAALDEELQFRLGAEKWSGRQRLLSCAMFGIAHLINLVYALATLGVLAVVGAVFMTVYLRDLRRTGDRRAAIVAAAKLHANYNLLAIGISVVVIGLYWIYMIGSLISTN